MVKFLLLFIFLIPSMSQGQVITTQACQNAQNDAQQRTNQINYETSDLVTQQAQLAADNATIVQCNASYAQTVSGVNWDYFVSLEPSDPFSSWSKIANGINWTSVVANIGINCGGITEANVNWTNWGTCEANGMTPGLPFGGKNTGIAAFWCGNGKITGTC